MPPCSRNFTFNKSYINNPLFSLPTKGVLLANCEAELTQLMKQIDVMVQAKRAEWLQERQILQAKLDVREQEHTLTKSTLEQKHQEVSSRGS